MREPKGLLRLRRSYRELGGPQSSWRASEAAERISKVTETASMAARKDSEAAGRGSEAAGRASEATRRASEVTRKASEAARRATEGAGRAARGREGGNDKENEEKKRERNKDLPYSLSTIGHRLAQGRCPKTKVLIKLKL